MIDTRFWSDSFIVDLNPLDRYLFLYFLTNEHTNIAGIYELPLKRVSDETGLEKDMIEKMLKRLDGRVIYIEGWVAIKNFSKYQSDNESVRKGIENAKALIPSHILQCVDTLWQGVDTKGTASDISELELESELKLKKELKVSKAVALQGTQWNELIDSFKEVNPSFSEFYSNRTERSALEKMVTMWGYEKTLHTIQGLSQIINQPYAPKITKPTELKRDIGKLVAFYKQEQSKITSKRKLII